MINSPWSCNNNYNIIMPIKRGTERECRLPAFCGLVFVKREKLWEIEWRVERDQNICSNWVQWGGQSRHFTRHNPQWCAGKPGGASQVISIISLEKLLTAGCLLFFQVELVWRIICFGHHQSVLTFRPEQENTKTFNSVLSVIQTSQ